MSDTTLVKAEINDEPNIGDYFALLKPESNDTSCLHGFSGDYCGAG